MMRVSKADSIVFSPNQGMIFFLLSYVLIYSILAVFLFPSVLPDSAQNISWGHSLRWSYNRHPPLGTWLIYALNRIGPNNEWAAFSASTLCLSTSLFFIYGLAKRYMCPSSALTATLLSSLTMFYLCNFVLQFNQNTIMLPFWVMVAYFSDGCFRENRVQDWLGLGVCAALALLAKYESILIIALAFLYLIVHFDKKYRYKLLLSFFLFLLILMPHVYSLLHTGFLTIDFIHTSMHLEEAPTWISSHLYFPLKALLEQVGHVFLAILVFIGFAVWKGFTKPLLQDKKQGNYLVYLGVAPLCLVLLISSILGIKIQGEWGYPLYAFSFPALFFRYPLNIKQERQALFIVFVILFHLLSLLVYKYADYYSSKPRRTNNPSLALAQKAKVYWQRYSKEAIRFVGGDEYIDYYLSAYLKEKPLLFENYSLKKSPWLNEEQLKRHGLFMVMYGCNTKKNETLKKQFHAADYACVKVPLNNKSRRQTMKLTFMVIPPLPKLQ